MRLRSEERRMLPLQLAPGRGGEAGETPRGRQPPDELTGCPTGGSPRGVRVPLLSQPDSCQMRGSGHRLDEFEEHGSPAGVRAGEVAATDREDCSGLMREIKHHDATTKLGGDQPCRTEMPENRALEFAGKTFAELGGSLNGTLQQLIWTRHGKILTKAADNIYPLPLGAYPGIHPSRIDWVSALLQGLNSLYGCQDLGTWPPTEVQKTLVLNLARFVDRMWLWDEKIPRNDFGAFFEVKGVDYRGEEIQLAKPFNWESIAGALPKEVGSLELAEFCEGGCKHYVEHFESYLLPPSEQLLGRPPPCTGS
eukprot:s66_g14.t1